MVSVNEFIREYSRAIINGYAAVFAGAGLSRPSGFVNWKELIRSLAEDIGLDVEKESDLVAISQYYKNDRGGRSGINQRILNEFTKNVILNENVKLLTGFPISTYWTTNYDSLLEDGLKENNRKADIKITQTSLAVNIYDRDAVVYKMHGDANSPRDAVLTKDDYELYGISRPLFRTALQGDLISKTFLFVGFSFEDPNLDYILSQIRILLGESTRDHYCFFEELKQYKGESADEYSYRKIKQEFRIQDLKRYGIQAVVLESYAQITDILKEIQKKILTKNIFISSSISQYSDPWSEETVNKFTYDLSGMLVHSGYKLFSGFGNGIGSSVVNGALNEIMKSKYKHVDDHLCLRPFPQFAPNGENVEDLWTAYRENMIGESGIAIFMFGNKKNSETDCKKSGFAVADGMIKEFKIAKEKSCIIIPLGSTGWAAEYIFKEVARDIPSYPYLTEYLEILRSSTNTEELIRTVCTIVNQQQIC